MNENPLEFPFTRDGFEHQLVERQGDVCLVERKNKRTGSIHYEVILVQHHPARTFPDGRTVPAREGYPADSQWGIAAWTRVTLPDARACFGDVLLNARIYATLRPYSPAPCQSGS
jgi:hypothetical protein